MTPNKRDLKAYVRFDGSGRVVPGSLVLRRKKPKVGKWVEINAYECCGPNAPASFYKFDLAFDNSAANACASLPSTDPYYCGDDTIMPGSILYMDSNLTTPVANGWYASESTQTAYQVTGGYGQVTDTEACI